MIKIKRFEMFKDGGTIRIETSEGTFSFDRRIRSTTKGRLYSDYPKPDNSNIIEDSEELEYRIIKSLKSYRNNHCQKTIDNLIKSKSHLFRDDIISEIIS